jgi:8-oxo-dGTP pyrophosphatase MutT (NUDIX family)
MVKQRRIQSGDFTYEFPSGKIEDCSKPNFSAALELSEETGINIQPECLRLLAKDIVVCESAFDEQVTWYSCEISEKDYLKNLNCHHGIKEDGEHITIHALTFDALKEINSFQVKTALQLLLENQIINLGAMKN